jgi:L-asparaginase II
MLLTRDSILQAEDLPRREVPVPEWGGSVYVRMMTGSERDAFEAVHLKNPTVETRARIAVATVCDDTGKNLFDPGDVAAVGKKSFTALERIAQVALELNRIGSADIDELEKNSAASPSDSSPSA